MNLDDFEKDIFISYAHIDDEALTEEQAGWIETFHKTLEVRLAQVYGSRPRIWRDQKLTGNDNFGDEIVDQFPKVALLVSVVTPRYLKSEWCVKEVVEFCKAVEQTGGLQIGNKSRIFKVSKTPVSLEDEPDELKEMLGYQFYRMDPDRNRAVEFDRAFGEDLAREFIQVINDLAYDISDMLESISKGIEVSGNGGDSGQPGGKGTIYLALPSYDLAKIHEGTRRELQSHGYEVLPDRPLPAIGPELEPFVQEMLPRCQLALHLIGENYGTVLDGSTKSIVELQNEYAAQYSESSDLTRVIWMDPNVQPADERQQAFIEFLKTDASAQEGAEFLQTSLEELNTIVQVKLAPKKEEAAPEADEVADGGAEEDDLVRVYLVHDPKDEDAIAAVDDFLYDKEYEVLRPLTDGDEADVREDHKENLLVCDALIIYWGNSDERWLRTKLQDLRKAPGYGRTKPFLAKAVYVGGPESTAKQRYRTREADVIKQLEDFSGDELQSFIDQIEAGRKK